MAVSAGPKIENDELFFVFDARNTKTFDNIPGITDHGISDWYCFVNGTATYSAIYPNTEIIEITSDGTEVGIVTTGSDPQRGTFTTTSGRRYYGTKAIHLLQTTASDDQHELAPVSFAGTYFAHRWSRYSPQTYYAYAPQDDTTLEFFDNDASGGVTGTVTATYNISKGSTTSFQSTAISTWQFFKADKPIIMTAGGATGDKTILAPATQYTYTRRNANERTINNTAPSNAGSYVTYDTSLPTASVEIADGAGGDCTQGIGYEYLSDTYSWGDVLSDYQIVAPYADTTVTVSYWANSQWNVGEVHSLSSGTQTSPSANDRDGTNGFGVDGSTISGGAANLGSGANLWKWESTKPFALIINDNSDDEERLLGWMSNNYLRTSSNVNQSFVNLVDTDNRKRMKIYGKDLTTTVEYAGAKLSANDYIEFDGTNDYIRISKSTSTAIYNIGSTASIECWFKSESGTTSTHFGVLFGWGETGTAKYSNLSIGNWFSGASDESIHLGYNAAGVLYYEADGSTKYHDGNWHHVIATIGPNQHKIYVDGVSKSMSFAEGNNSYSVSNVFGLSSGSVVEIGRRPYNGGSGYFNGRISNARIYNKVLAAAEVQQNFNALRGRFGI